MAITTYHYIDDMFQERNQHRQPNLIWTDLRNKIIENEACKSLIKRLNDINPNFPDFRFIDYSTPLLLSCHYYQKYDFIEFLIIKKKANVNYSLVEWPEESMGSFHDPIYPSPFKKGFTPLMSIILSENVSKEKILKLLIENGANVNSRNEYDHTPLMYAVYHGNISIVRYLIAKGANVNAKNMFGLSCLDITFERKQTTFSEQIFRELIKNGADTQTFIQKWNLSKILALESSLTRKHEMFYFARIFDEHKINFICNLFEKGIGDPLKDYMLREINKK